MKRLTGSDAVLVVGIGSVFAGVWIVAGLGFALIALGIMLCGLSYLMAATESNDAAVE